MILRNDLREFLSYNNPLKLSSECPYAKIKIEMISKENVEYAANLARIEISEGEKAKFANDLSAIIDYVAELESAPTENITAINQIADLENISREDKITPSLPNKKVLENAPDKEGSFISVPKIFDSKTETSFPEAHPKDANE